jgi:hypothetical protein
MVQGAQCTVYVQCTVYTHVRPCNRSRVNSQLLIAVSMWNLWQTKSQRNKIFLEPFGFPLPTIIPPMPSIHLHIIQLLNNGPITGQSSTQIYYHPHHRKNKNKVHTCPSKENANLGYFLKTAKEWHCLHLHDCKIMDKFNFRKKNIFQYSSLD